MGALRAAHGTRAASIIAERKAVMCLVLAVHKRGVAAPCCVLAKFAKSKREASCGR